jgi:hypothetical protein
MVVYLIQKREERKTEQYNIKTGAKTTPAGSETKRNVESYDYHYKNR